MNRTSTPIEVGHDRLFEIPITDLRTSPENDGLYYPLGPSNVGAAELIESVAAKGIAPGEGGAA